jgi:hypothetical protein
VGNEYLLSLSENIKGSRRGEAREKGLGLGTKNAMSYSRGLHPWGLDSIGLKGLEYDS